MVMMKMMMRIEEDDDDRDGDDNDDKNDVLNKNFQNPKNFLYFEQVLNNPGISFRLFLSER